MSHTAKHLRDPNWPHSLWRATAEPLDDFAALQENTETDTAIIGAGYTGLSTALHLSDTHKNVIVIDKAQPGWGCSGRNGGQINPNWKVLPENFRRYYSDDQFNRIIKTAGKTTDLVFDLIKKHNIKCQAIRPGYVLGVKGKRELNFVNAWTKQWHLAGADVQKLDKQTIADLLGTDDYDGGMFDQRGGSLQPLSYARGLAKAVTNQDITIYGNTAATSITKIGQHWQITTPSGTIKSRALIIGMNGYTDQTFPGLAQTIVPVASLIIATEPLPDNIANKIIPNRNAVSESGGVPAYYRVDENNRMVFGGRGTISGHIGNLDTSALRKEAIRLFPLLKDAKWEYDWGGYVAMTTHHRPMLLDLGSNAYAGLGYNGRGLAMATMMGKQLAMIASGQQPDLPTEPLKKIPLHRFHNLGIASRIISGHIADTFTR